MKKKPTSAKANRVKKPGTPHPTAIVAIEISNLFGQYTYALSPVESERKDGAIFQILYGDNGAGKTEVRHPQPFGAC